MKDIKAYVVLPIEILPPKSGFYNVYNGDKFLGQDYYNYPDGWEYKIVTHWLKEISLSEYMVGFAEWCGDKYEQDMFCKTMWLHNTYETPHETSELLELYFIEQGIIIK